MRYVHRCFHLVDRIAACRVKNDPRRTSGLRNSPRLIERN
jgi:hypothetical protein